jgi:DNA polymerase elongation subunit (family B)
MEREGKTVEAQYYDTKQNSYKTFGNSLYGLLGMPHFHFYDIDNSASITGFGVQLIKTTVKKLADYFENGLPRDDRYFKTFDSWPTMNEKYRGIHVGIDGESYQNRMSHGDTDSFFVKYDDLYAPFEELASTNLETVIFDKGKVVFKKRFQYKDKKSFKEIEKICASNTPGWDDLEDDVRDDKATIEYAKHLYVVEKDAWDCYFAESTKYSDAIVNMTEIDRARLMWDGCFKDKKSDVRIIMNRFTLTDFSRMLDTCIMEEKLAEIMLDFSNYWNFYENTLFLKREKCILQAIVLAKKKYICYIESNEDIKTHEAKFKSTGVEIVRSSTPAFTRKYILDLVKEMVKKMDKDAVRKRYFEIKKEFYSLVAKGDVASISLPSGVKKDPPIWKEYIRYSDEEKKKWDWRIKVSAVWNHLIETDEELKKLPLEPVFESSKVKFLKVKENRFGLTAIAYVGTECPKRLFELFSVDWDMQWDKTFGETMGRFFEAVGWSKEFERDQRHIMKRLL